MMRNVTHPKASLYEKTQLPVNAAAGVFPNFQCNHPFGIRCLTSVREQSPKNEGDCAGAAAPGGLGTNAASPDKGCVLAILRVAYRVARCEVQRIQSDLDLLVGIVRALEAEIYDPAFALERALEHGLVAWADVEVAS